MMIQEINQKESRLSAKQIARLHQLYQYLSSQSKAEKNLKELKTMDQGWLSIAEDLDLFVQLGILERYDRRYRFCLPVVTKEMLADYQKIASRQLSLLADLTPKMRLMLAQSIHLTIPSTYIICEKKIDEGGNIYEIEGESLTFIDVTKAQCIVGLPSYFANQMGSQLKYVTEVRKRIGDVSIPFFMTFSERALLLLVKETAAPIRQTIFMSTLRDLGYLEASENKQTLKLMTPIEQWGPEEQSKLEHDQNVIYQGINQKELYAEHIIKNIIVQLLLVPLANQRFIFKKGDHEKND